MTTQSLTAQPGFLGWPNCEVCSLPLTDDDGVMEVDEALAGEYARAREHDSARYNSGAVVDLASVPLPESAHWRWAHGGCDPESRYSYRIPVERFNTYAKVLHWTWHLSKKGWFRSTDWFGAVSRAWQIDWHA